MQTFIGVDSQDRVIDNVADVIHLFTGLRSNPTPEQYRRRPSSHHTLRPFQSCAVIKQPHTLATAFRSPGSGYIAGEPLVSFMRPNTSVSTINRDSSHLNQPGDIILYASLYASHLNSSVLGATMFPHSVEFKRYITDTAGQTIGFMIMKRAVPDPETLLQKLEQDPWLDTLPAGLRSAELILSTRRLSASSAIRRV
ncbi:MAG: hypothetical protein Q9169_000056 [Polycauliona sp. 2 TL-2023]